MADDNDWKQLFGAAGRPWPKGPCPQTGDADIAHLAECAVCREQLLLSRRRKTERVSPELRNRLYALQSKSRRVVWIAAAAAALVAVVLTMVLARSPEPTPVVVTPPKPRPTPVVLPPPTPDVPLPRPEAPLPEKAPSPTPPPPPPLPKPEPPVVATPLPVPEKTAPAVPVPEKPAPEPTRAALKGTLFAVAGSCSVQGEGDAATQSLKPGQKREFPGTIRLKADTAASKVAVGPVTYYVQRASELSIQLQEGRTHVQLVRGEVFFDVTPGNGVFEVEGALGKVTVKGTRFLVSETDVLVQRGAVDFNATPIAAGERGFGKGPAQKADLARRLAWIRGLEEYLWIEGEQMALQGGMTILPDATASGGRAIGAQKPGVEASAEIRGKRKQAVPYSVWVRLSWPHNVPSALSLSVGDNLRWTSKDIVSAQGWQWVRAGTTELPDDPFRIRFTDPKVGLRIDQVLVTSDPDFNPDTDKR